MCRKHSMCKGPEVARSLARSGIHAEPVVRECGGYRQQR
jgi:hypothetical protein